MKKWIFIAVAFLLLAAGGRGRAPGISCSRRNSARPPRPDAGAPDQGQEFEIMEMQALSIPVIRNGELQKYVLINVSLELDGPESRVFVYSRMAKLEDAFFRDLHGYFGSVADTSKVNVRLLTVRLQRQAQVLGRAPDPVSRKSTSRRPMNEPARRRALHNGGMRREWRPTAWQRSRPKPAQHEAQCPAAVRLRRIVGHRCQHRHGRHGAGRQKPCAGTTRCTPRCRWRCSSRTPPSARCRWRALMMRASAGAPGFRSGS